MKKVLRYILGSLEGPDGVLSIRRVLAVFFSVVFFVYITGANPAEGIATVISLLIIGLLGITTAQNVFNDFFKTKTGETVDPPKE